MGGIVTEVTTLDLAMEGRKLRVNFTGKRHKHYTNRPATTIAF